MITHIQELEIASELAWGISVDCDPEDADKGSFEFVHDEHEDRGRWEIYHTIVFRHHLDGESNLYAFSYNEPATEYQEGTIEERFEAVPVPVYPVAAKKVITMAYERVSNG